MKGLGGGKIDTRQQGGKLRSLRSIMEVRCYMCKQLGHIKRDCPQRKKEMGEGFRSELSSVAAESDVSNDLLMLSTGYKEETNQ